MITDDRSSKNDSAQSQHKELCFNGVSSLFMEEMFRLISCLTGSSSKGEKLRGSATSAPTDKAQVFLIFPLTIPEEMF